MGCTSACENLKTQLIAGFSPPAVRLRGIAVNRHRRHFPPYRQGASAGLRTSAEYLLDYLNTTYFCGPVHAICERPSCGRMAMEWRGGRKYCSEDSEGTMELCQSQG